MTNKLLKLPAVLSLVAMSRAALYEKVRSGEFPRPVRLGARAVAWPESDIAGWIADRIAAAAAANARQQASAVASDRRLAGSIS